MLTPICSAAALVDKSVLFDNSASLILFKPTQHFSILSHYKTHQYMLREERDRKSTRNIVETVTALASVMPLNYVCRRAVRTRHASAESSRVVRAMGPTGRAARVGKATWAAGGMQVNRGRPGAWPSSVSSRSASLNLNLPRFH